MTVTIKDLIASAANKDPSEFEANFDSVMSSKISDALETKYDEMFGGTQDGDETDIESEEETENEDA